MGKPVWDKWWAKKLISNQTMIEQAKKGNYDQVAKLIDCNYNDDSVASINYQEPKTGMTALHYAVKAGNMRLVNLILSNNADVMVQDSKGQTPLHLACMKGDLEAYQELTKWCYQSKTSVDAANKTPLDYAMENKHAIILQYEKQASVTLFSQTTHEKMNVQDFEIINQLGRGAFGQVFLVLKDSQYYAMKVMKKRKYNGILNLVLTEKEV